jgi:hypothetical protein
MRRGEITGRSDVTFWRYTPLLLERLAGARYPLATLASLVSEEPEYGAGARAVERVSPSQPRYIRITDFGDDGIEPNHTFAAPDPVEEACALERDDLLFARSGATVGKTYLHEDTAEPAIFAGYCIRFRIARTRATPRFVYWFTKTRIYELWVLATQRPAGQPNINKEEYKALQLPLPGDLKEQETLVAAMDAARAQRLAKMAQADALLAGLDAFLLSTLGLSAPPTPKTVFAILNGDLTGMLNPDRYRAMSLEKHLPFDGHVGDVGELLEARSSPEREGPEELWDWIRIDDLPNQPWQVEALRTEPGKNICGTFFEVRENDLLIARLGPTILNAKFVLCPKLKRRTVASSEFLVLRCNPGWRPEAALWILRTRLYRDIMYLRSRGGTPSRFRLDGADLASIPFPKLAAPVQSAITAEVSKGHETSRRLRAEAEAEWQAAKRHFEEQLLTPART